VKRTIAFIINPQSGTDRIKSLKDLIAELFDKKIFDIEIIYTEYAGHAKIISKEMAAKNFETVVAVGGDGTVNEVASGLIGTETALGIVPKGSGNGLARACNISLKSRDALETIAKGYIKNIDAGIANGEYFLSNAGVGFDAHVTQRCLDENTRGIIMYIKKSVSSFYNYKASKYEINIDGENISKRAIMISIANGNEFGYGFKIAPTASLVDGVLDVMIIKPLNFFTAGRVSFYAWWGNLHKYSKVKHIRGRSIFIKSDELNCHQIDGDFRTNKGELKIEILPKALNVIVP
jgi:diacylglycerol kinase (ATP)